MVDLDNHHICCAVGSVSWPSSGGCADAGDAAVL